MVRRTCWTVKYGSDFEHSMIISARCAVVNVGKNYSCICPSDLESWLSGWKETGNIQWASVAIREKNKAKKTLWLSQDHYCSHNAINFINCILKYGSLLSWPWLNRRRWQANEYWNSAFTCLVLMCKDWPCNIILFGFMWRWLALWLWFTKIWYKILLSIQRANMKVFGFLAPIYNCVVCSPI